MACRWHTDKKSGLRYHVPECWGTVHDPDGPCHCPDRVPDAEDLDDFNRQVDKRIKGLERDIARLSVAIENLKKMKK